MADFYSQLLSYEIGTRTEDFAKLSNDSSELLLHQIPIEHQEAISVPPSLREDSVWKPIFDVSSIDAARNSAHKHGGHIKDSSSEWNLDSAIYCDGNDPEGNIIQLRMQIEG